MRQRLKRNPALMVFVLGLLFIFGVEWVMQPYAIQGVYFQRWSSEDMMQTVSVVDLRAEPLASLYYLHVQPPLLDAIRAALAQLWPTVDARTLVVNVSQLYSFWQAICRMHVQRKTQVRTRQTQPRCASQHSTLE